MLNNITGIMLCGANFETASELKILDPHEGNKVKPVKGALLYGRNGAGKSTIAKAFKKAKGNPQETISQASFLDINSGPVLLTEEEQSRVFVFDEEFVDKNVKMREAGLDTIIMLGQQAELAGKIEAAQNALELAKAEYIAQESVVLEHEKCESIKSPKYYIQHMRWALQGDDCWAGRDKIIKNNRQNTGVRDDTYEQFVRLTTTKSRDVLLVEFNDTLKDLRRAQQGEETISHSVPVFSLDYDEDAITVLLRTKIEKPDLSEREKYLLSLVQSGNTPRLNKMIGIFSDKGRSVCPTCLQRVTEEYKTGLVESIQRVLSKEVEEHQVALQSYIVQEIALDLAPFAKLSNNFGKCNRIIEQVNNALKSNNLIIQSKFDSPYLPCDTELQNVSSMITQLKEALQALEEERVEYNTKITLTEPIKRKLTEINNLIAYYDIRELYVQYLACKAQLKIEYDKQREKQNAYLKAKQQVDDLEAQRKNVRVALSIINNSLNYIFFSNDRFKIDYRDENYILPSNGKPVKPSQISQGERNIIGLCYFFASILQNQDASMAYSKEYLLLIDDPISSFDIENKVGIMSFLRYQLGKFMLGNQNTKAIIMTHDLLTYYDTEKIFGELMESCKSKFGGEKPIFKHFELRNQELILFSLSKRQEYTELIKIVYDFALGNANEYEMTIGNIMRQVLEAFATFQYKKGIDEISTDSDILAVLPEEEYRIYFENLMYRLILNNGSHRLDQTKSMTDMNFFSVISAFEKQKTAKEILCFIYLLNKRHLLSHLRACTDANTNLSQWCSEIKAKVGVKV